MRTIEINLASRPFHNNLLFHLGYGIGVLAVAGFTAYNFLTFTRYSRAVAELNEQLASGRARLEEIQREGERLKKEIDRRDLKDLAQRIKAANGILLEREFSWTRLLGALEEAQPYKVRLLELRPVVTPAGVLIQARGISRDLDNFWELQQRLQDHPMFRRVYPTGYSRQPGGGEFVFSISFNYFPNPQEAPGEGQAAAVTPETVTGSRNALPETAGRAGENGPAEEADSGGAAKQETTDDGEVAAPGAAGHAAAGGGAPVAVPGGKRSPGRGK